MLEQRIVAFLDEERAAGRLPPSCGSELFHTEEVKHIRLFRRVADGLKARRPARHRNIARMLDAHITQSLETAWWYNDRVENYPSAAVYHYVCWLHFLYFEEYSIYLYNQLKNSPGIQTLWLSAHAAHMREETQHVRTDAGYLDRLDLHEASREQWGRWFIQQSAKDAGGLAGLEGVRTFLVELYPQLSGLPMPIALIDNMDLRHAAFLRLLNHKNAFLRTKRGARLERFEEGLFKTGSVAGKTGTKDDASAKDSAAPPGEDSEAVGRMRDLIVSAIARHLKMDAERVDVNQHLMLFGLDSVGALSISAELEQALQIKLPVNLLFEHETIAELAGALAGMDVTFSEEGDRNELEFDASIFQEPQSGERQNIFLTGATGFLCAFVLAEKLKSSRDQVTCLVRAGNPEQGLQRIENNLRGYGIWRDGFAERIRVVTGDLGEKRFGLGEVFHLTNPNPTPWSEIFGFLGQLGYSIQLVPYGQWMESMTRAGEREAAILPYLAYFKTRSERWQLRQPPFSCTNTEEALKPTGISCPRIDKPLLEIYPDYFKRIGFISEFTVEGKA
uniref:Phosphopantetheine attachment site n=1 Tax=Candidatus Kentrum eta TaxID=2126337 RepID=A0A450UYV5_9GAMM|nr:MAG: Phosphopantetheine attachment site [Candidatus Kentron sp. H]VFJ97626.1 MAG: Phosphopantetheine attachment site [Candidatus Kentron sp. H]VFK03179.1 MAG: Phosphopantetheine attachment site [Candidatus Kentron sp. H]